MNFINQFKQTIKDTINTTSQLIYGEKIALPWEFPVDNEQTRQASDRILKIAQDEQSFYMDEQTRVYGMPFDFESIVELANQIVESDQNLGVSRRKLVPMKMSDEQFWHNYFYQVECIKMDHNLPHAIELVDDVQI